MSEGVSARSAAVAVGAVAQVAVSAWAGPDVGARARADGSTILPAGWAFSIWGLIFLLSLVYAVLLFTPARRSVSIGGGEWWLAVAFLANTLWMVVFTSGLVVVAQVVIIVGAVAAIRALLAARHWFACVITGLLAGWLTAATFVGVATTLTHLGVSPDAVIVGVVLLVLAAAVAGWVLLRGGPLIGSIAYTAAVVWALAGVMAEQWTRLTGIVALVLAVVLAALLVYRARPSV